MLPLVSMLEGGTTEEQLHAARLLAILAQVTVLPYLRYCILNCSSDCCYCPVLLAAVPYCLMCGWPACAGFIPAAGI